MAGSTVDRPIRFGVFDNARAADHAVEQLLAAGFSSDRITVICSDPRVQHHFEEFEHQEPAGYYAPLAAIVGGVSGAIVFAVAAVSLTAAFGAGERFGYEILAGVAVLAAGGGAVVGSLIGAMLTRGTERELANYYDQAVPPGEILVAAETEDPKQADSLVHAERILAGNGVHPMSLREG